MPQAMIQDPQDQGSRLWFLLWSGSARGPPTRVAIRAGERTPRPLCSLRIRELPTAPGFGEAEHPSVLEPELCPADPGKCA